MPYSVDSSYSPPKPPMQKGKADAVTVHDSTPDSKFPRVKDGV